jgi:uncharacterized protein (TIGR00251 family)
VSQKSTRIAVRVQPRSSKNALAWEAGNIRAWITAPPVDGAANEALVSLLAERLDLPKRAITIVRGTSGKQKLVEIAGLTLNEIQSKIG